MMEPSALLAAAALCVLHTYIIQVCLAEPKDYCQWDRFNPRCGQDAVVMMNSALYGRMTSGRCIEHDYGYVGCHADVLMVADTLCSGRHNCSLQVPVEKFKGEKTSCPIDLSRFLSADYSCLKVETPSRSYCYSHSTVPLSARSGWIASITTQETGCGSTDTPWLLTIPPGQTVNFTLYDFSVKSALGNNTRGLALGTRNCHVYAIFKEKASKRYKTICGGESRVSQAYFSTSNQVEVRIMTSTNPRYFLLKYDVLGCPDPDPPAGGWTERHGDTLDMGCEDEDSVWTLTCVGNKWTGDSRNCTQYTAATGSELTFAGISFPHTLSIVVILAVALFIGMMILAIGLVCLKKRRERAMLAAPRPPFGPLGPAGYKDDMNYKTTSTTCTGYSHPSFMTRSDISGENDYEYVDDIKPPPPVTGGSTLSKMAPYTGNPCAAHGVALNQYGFDGTLDLGRGAKTPQHQPSNPALQVHHLPVGSNIVPQYYELDPENNPPKDGNTRPPSTSTVIGQPPSDVTSTAVTRALSEETAENGERQVHRQNMNFGHYSQ